MQPSMPLEVSKKCANIIIKNSLIIRLVSLIVKDECYGGDFFGEQKLIWFTFNIDAIIVLHHYKVAKTKDDSSSIMLVPTDNYASMFVRFKADVEKQLDINSKFAQRVMHMFSKPLSIRL